jgi:acyl carrier protein
VSLPTVSDVGYVAKTLEQKQKGSVTYDMGCSISEAEVRLFMQAAVSARDMLPPDGESAITDHGQTVIGISVSPNLASQAWAQPSLFSHYRRLCSDSSSAAGGHRDESAQGQSLKDILGAHMEFGEAFNVIFEAVAGRIAGIMMKSEDISPEDRIVDLGLDSLIAVEIRNWIVKQVDVNLTVIDIVNSGTVAQLVRVIIEKSNMVQVS